MIMCDMKRVMYIMYLCNSFLLQGFFGDYKKDTFRLKEWHARCCMQREELAEFCLIQKMFHDSSLESQVALEQKIASMYEGPLHQSWPDKERKIVIFTKEELEHAFKVRKNRSEEKRYA